MGASAKRKREKKQDFQKPKLKVGKARPKAENQTDTSFRSKAIVLNQQSLNVSSPSVTHQFQHHVSLLSSRTDTQRKESLSYLTTFVLTKPVDHPLPQPAGTILERICPLVLDGSQGVRSQLLKFMQSLQATDVQDHVVKILPFIRAGMTHLSRDIRASAIDVMSWLLSVAGNAVVSCSGGWHKTLESFVTLLGWRLLDDASKWSSSKASFGSEIKAITRAMQVFAQFLKAGLTDEDDENVSQFEMLVHGFPCWHVSNNQISAKSNAYIHLNLFGATKSDDTQILEDPEDRLYIFNDRFRPSVATGIEAAKQEGGELGRAAGLLTKVLKQTEVTE